MVRFAIPILALTLTGCAATPAQIAREQSEAARIQARLDTRLAGYTPGRTTSCIQPRNANVDIFGDTLVYRDTNARLYKTTTNGGCFGLRRQDIIVTLSPTGQLCRGDIVRTIDRASGFPSGACAFGDFVVYTRNRRS